MEEIVMPLEKDPHEINLEDFVRKINSTAFPNQMVIGGDLYQVARSLKEYCFNQISPYSLGQKLDYPAYSLCRTT